MKPSEKIQELIENRLKSSDTFSKLGVDELEKLTAGEAALVCVTAILDFLDEKSTSPKGILSLKEAAENLDEAFDRVEKQKINPIPSERLIHYWEELDQAATPGPWYEDSRGIYAMEEIQISGDDRIWILDRLQQNLIFNQVDGLFITESRKALPVLLRAFREQQREIEYLLNKKGVEEKC